MSQNNPIENAKKAVSANDEATLKEEATLLYADWYLLKNTGDGTETRDADKYVKDNLQGDYGDLVDRLNVSNKGTITISEPLEVVEGVTIPRGFVHVADTTVATGLVIKNSTDGNEFVWVPVAAGTFAREGFGTDISSYSEPYEEEGYTSERAEYDAMVASVGKYGGFYIARYEASQNETTGKAQSLANKTTWNGLPCGTSMTDVTGGVVEAARAVYPVSSANQGDAVSTLPYGVQWDATVRFILTQYPEEILSDSQNYGNYADPVTYTGDFINTGDPTHPEYMLNNIYDLAGNEMELTMETSSNSGRVGRGGGAGAPGSSNTGYSISDRLDGIPINVDNLGFRMTLYIK